MAICHARGVALSVFRWIRKWCIVKTPDGKVVDDLPSKFVANLLDALIAYKRKAETHSLVGAPHCSLSMLEAQISNVVKLDDSIDKCWREKRGPPSTSLIMTMEEGCSVQWKDDVPISICCRSK